MSLRGLGSQLLTVGGSTVSSIFSPNSSHDRIIQKLRGVNLIIIDEDATCPLHFLGVIDRQCRIANSKNIPFGGAHLIIAGDMRQLK